MCLLFHCFPLQHTALSVIITDFWDGKQVTASWYLILGSLSVTLLSISNGIIFLIEILIFPPHSSISDTKEQSWICENHKTAQIRGRQKRKLALFEGWRDDAPLLEFLKNSKYAEKILTYLLAYRQSFGIFKYSCLTFRKSGFFSRSKMWGCSNKMEEKCNEDTSI